MSDSTIHALTKVSYLETGLDPRELEREYEREGDRLPLYVPESRGPREDPSREDRRPELAEAPARGVVTVDLTVDFSLDSEEL